MIQGLNDQALNAKYLTEANQRLMAMAPSSEITNARWGIGAPQIALDPELENQHQLPADTSGFICVHWTFPTLHAPVLEQIVPLHQRWYALRWPRNPETVACDNLKSPILSLLRAWHHRPVIARQNIRNDRILPTRIAMAPRDYGAARLFLPPAHAEGEQILPGFEIERSSRGPALPLRLYDLGMSNIERKRAGPAAPLPLRIFIESILAVRLEDRKSHHPITIEMLFREFLKKLYPGNRLPKPSEYWLRLHRAREALESFDARIPWRDEETGRGALRQVVTLPDFPTSCAALNDVISVRVDLPPGSEIGPAVSPELAKWGLKSAAAYRALLNLAYWWFQPGITRIPVRGGKHWIQSHNPNAYDKLTDNDLVALCFPTSTVLQRKVLVHRAHRTIQQLEEAGELIVKGRRLLPPAKPPKDLSG